jgi:hypothetical protein
MADNNVKILVCVEWGQQIVSSERRECSKCGVAIAIDQRNIGLAAELNMQLICPRHIPSDYDFGGGLVGGERVEMEDTPEMRARVVNYKQKILARDN